MNRKPAVAGTFYPGNIKRLEAFLGDAVHPAAEPLVAVGVVSPHAGYVYSGRVAGAVFGRVTVPNTVLLLGPNHTGMGTPASIAHEHSLEVQVPFLLHRNPAVRIVPVAFMLRTFAEVEEVGLSIAEVIKTWPDPVLMVASSDMTHYESADHAKDKDAKAIARVLELDAQGLLDTTKRFGITMCGAIPTAVLLVAARALGATRGELVTYATSGDVSGDYGSVVGYAGMVIA